MSRTSVGLVATALVIGAGCGPGEVTFSFAGLIGGEPARCGGTYAGLGTSSAELTVEDFRVYIHDLRVVTDDGREVPVELAQDGTWQHEDLALLDFEDHSGACEAGSNGTNREVVGAVDEDPAAIAGVRFRLGVPFALNHGNVSTAPAPLNVTGMFWGWNAGYKFVRVDGRTTGLPQGYNLHVGSTGCTGDGRGNIESCRQENRAEVELTGFDPRTDTIAIDLAELLSESDLNTDAGGQPGCMGGFDDPDCEAIFHGLGLPFDGRPATAPQRLFRVVPAAE